MPMRDHFLLPIEKRHRWEAIHAMLTMTIVQHLGPLLPDKYSSAPRVHLGSNFDNKFRYVYKEESPLVGISPRVDSRTVATVTWAPPIPTFTIDADLPEEYAYEVLVHDDDTFNLVAAIELVSPGNKDRPQNRRAFVAKCATLMQQGVCVSIVDLVTIRKFNLYADLLAMLEQSDPTYAAGVPSTYVATCRQLRIDDRYRLQTWAYPLTIGQPLPPLPVWLTEDFAVSLDLEASYESACKSLRIS